MLLAGCGARSSSGSTTGVSYAVVTPADNSERIYTWTIVDNFNSTIVNDMGQETSYLTESSSAPRPAADPHKVGPTYPLTVGMTWTLQYTVTCGTSRVIAFDQSRMSGL